MFGNLLTNRQLRQLIKTKELYIEPLNPGAMKTAHYTLHPGRILTRQVDGSWRSSHDFKEDGSAFVIQKNDYVLVEVREMIRVATDGIVGRFIHTSNLIESGLDLVSGQIDNKYGMRGEAVRLGLKNMLDVPVRITSDSRLAHVEFFDLRGIAFDPVELSKEELNKRVRAIVYAMDNGVCYDQDED
ncbi:MAG: hypothetical protein LWW92_04515 [Rhodocyclales bacterium]|nr:hypothetical protein [Rhodocyclales bacterium]